MGMEEHNKKVGRIIARAWEDEAFKQRLLADATAVLKEEGLHVPDGLTVLAVENTDTVFHLVLPENHAGLGARSDAELDAIAGGAYDPGDNCRYEGPCIIGIQ